VSTENKVKAGFEALARELEPNSEAWHRLEATVRTRQRRHYFSVVLLVLVIVGAVSVAIYSSQRSAGLIKPSPSSRFSTYSNAFGWSMKYPNEWRLQPFHDVHRVTFDGALVTNINHAFVHVKIPGGFTTAWNLRDLPDNVVIVQFANVPTGIQVRPSGPDTPFPLSLDRAQPLPSQEYGGPPAVQLYVKHGSYERYFLMVWMGPNASEADKRIAREIVASLRFDDAPSPAPSQPTYSPIATPEAYPTAPPSPEVGARYYFTLNTHCGIEFAYFGNRYWRTGPLNDGNGNPPMGWRNPVDPGTILLQDADHAVFQDPDGHVLAFRPAPRDTKVPMCA
jgi:hypothetical protein